jgi:protein-S-isoprenylcysteine O-methyltransferase Ste14
LRLAALYRDKSEMVTGPSFVTKLQRSRMYNLAMRLAMLIWSVFLGLALGRVFRSTWMGSIFSPLWTALLLVFQTAFQPRRIQQEEVLLRAAFPNTPPIQQELLG